MLSNQAEFRQPETEGGALFLVPVISDTFSHRMTNDEVRWGVGPHTSLQVLWSAYPSCEYLFSIPYMLRSFVTASSRSARTFTSTTKTSFAMSYTLPPQLPESHSQFTNQGEPKIHLLTKGTPNGYKVSVLLEELRGAYPKEAKLAYDFVNIQFDKNEQKSAEFLKVNPNGRIPALIDDNVQVDGKGHNVFESVSILLWLVEKYDPESKFWFTNEIERSKAFSWLFFGHGGEQHLNN